MKLASLRIFGFKTFAQATTLTFDSDVIAIVGPNGSGKSNLVDAIRWVLGEQSTKSLRSSKTDDVIFAGNSKRKPLGMAEVSLTFDNSDGTIDLPFKEVQITRRAYRAGDIEYYLNKERVRLRDIHEMLMGTGLGPGSYAIVSQGQIDQILVSKPSERRALFEETAGVNKFIARKAEAMRRLEGTNTNVIRINDLLRDVQTRVPEVEAQVRRATRYRNLSVRVRDMEVLSTVRACASRQEALDKAQQEAARSAAGLAEAAQAAISADEALVAARSELSLAERVFEESRGKADAARALLSHSEREAAAVRARLGALESQANSAESELERRAQERERLSARLLEIETEIEPLRQRVAELVQEEQLATEQLAAERKSVEGLFAALRDEETRANARLTEITQLNTAREAGQRDHVRISGELDRINDEWSQLDEQLRDDTTAAAQVIEQRAERAAAITAAEAELGGAEARLAHASSSVPQAQEQLRAASREVASLESRLTTLEELEANLEGHVPGTRAVMEASARGELSGIIGVVSSLIDVDEQYARALDVAFGAGVSNIITDSSTSAEQAIEYLRSRERGRATLLPLELVANRRGKDLGPLSRIPGVIAYAHELVRADERYLGAVAFLVGRTLVVDNMRTGVRLARQEQVRDSIVTLEGDQLIGGGAMSGGRSGRGERSLLARRAQVQALREEHLPATREGVMDAEADLAKATAEFNVATIARDDVRRKLFELRNSLRELEQREKMQRTQSDQAQTRATRLAARRDELSQQLTDVSSRLAALPNRVEAMQVDDSERNRLDADLTAARARIVDVESRTHVVRRNASQARERLAALGAQIEAARAQVAVLAADADRQTGQHDSNQAEIELLRQRVAEVDVEHAQLRANAEAAAASVRELLQARDQIIERIENGERTARTARQLERERLEGGEAIRRRVAELESALSVLQQQFAESPVGAEERAEIAERYVGQPDAILADLPKLRDDLARLSNVNLNAEADRDELVARETELTGQLEDFARARELLLDGIRELDETSQTQFLKTFDTVRQAFAETYAELFPGGEAHMWLADPEKPNESGIEISVQPPGKRMTSLAALSGGERAMTGVALIFALIRVKPSPFYLLDEIDAALDEMNVERFSRMVRTLAAQAQLLIVTHNKKTMELAQRMYGITMAEPGVSSVVTAALDRELVTA
jgi:chromosome segregation protein